MKRLYSYRYECLAGLLTVVLFIMGFYLKAFVSAEHFGRSALFAFFVADGAALYFTVRKLWRTKWRALFVAVLQRAVARIAGRLISFFEQRMRGKKATVLSGKTTVSFDLPTQDKEKQRSAKALKWKKLKDDRERLGYLYKHMIEKRIKHGSVIRSYNTPCEIREQENNEELEERIFELYIGNRYKETVDTDTQTLDELKNELGKIA